MWTLLWFNSSYISSNLKAPPLPFLLSALSHTPFLSLCVRRAFLFLTPVPFFRVSLHTPASAHLFLFLIHFPFISPICSSKVFTIRIIKKDDTIFFSRLFSPLLIHCAWFVYYPAPSSPLFLFHHAITIPLDKSAMTQERHEAVYDKKEPWYELAAWVFRAPFFFPFSIITTWVSACVRACS